MQQVVGNIASAALFPIMLACRDEHNDMSRALLFLAAVLFIMCMIYTTYNAPYRRYEMECAQHACHETTTLLRSTSDGYGSVTVVQDDDG